MVLYLQTIFLCDIIRKLCYAIHDNYRDYRETLVVIIGMRFFIIAQHYFGC